VSTKSVMGSPVATPAACIKRLVKHAIAFARSEALMPRSRMESNAMLSWRGTTDGTGVVGTGFGELLILLLLGDSRITKGASPKTALDEETMQISQRSDIGARRANLHAGAGGQIQHPGCQHNYYAGCRLNVDNPAAGALLAVLLSNTASVEWMPAVMDLDFLPDMGRMNGRLHLEESRGYLPAPIAEDGVLPPCTASSSRQK
jgi:hypothetical protein